MATIELKTPGGRILTLSRDAMGCLEEVGLADGAQADSDVEQIATGRSSVADLLDLCQRGADEDRIAGWSDYVQEVARVAQREAEVRS